MTTYLFEALKFVRDDVNGDVMTNIELELVFPEATGYVWTYDNAVTGRPFIDPDDESGGINSIEYYTGTLSPDAYDARESSGFQLFGRDIDVGAFDVEWGDSLRASFLLLYDEEADTDYFIFLGGDNVDDFATAEDFDTWAETELTGLHPVTDTTEEFGPGGTGWVFENSQYFITSSEDDYIQDVSGTDAFDTGLGLDEVIPLWGDDVIDMGSEGGDDDWDTLDYSIDHLFQNPDAGDSGPTQGIVAELRAGTLHVEDSWGDNDTATGVEQLQGTQMDDYLEADDSRIFFRFRGFEGDDTYIGHNRNYDSIDYRADRWFEGGDSAITADFRGDGPHAVIDGFGDTDTVSNIDYIRATNFDDTVYLGDREIRVRTEDGNDLIYGTVGGRGQIEAGEGRDELNYSLLDGGNGINVSFGKALVKGGNGRDRFEDIEVVTGSQYRDVIAGDSSDQIFNGGDGNDVFRTRGGTDEVHGDAGDDLVIGTGSGEWVSGGEGADIVRVYGGDDEVYGDAGADILRLGSGADYAEGGADDDRIFGQGGDDEIDAGDGNDYVEGGNGRDLIFGGDGDDVLKGEGSLDTLIGDAGDDTLWGGDGRDTFVFSDTIDGGRDTIKDWQDGLDTLDLSDFGFTDFENEVKDVAVNVGTANMRIDLTPEVRIVIENFRVEDFDASDVFLFA